MTLELQLAQDFGLHLADGVEAAKYRSLRIDPVIPKTDRIVFDFTGVRNANSSFINALISGLVEDYGEGLVKKMVFKGCNPLLRVLVESAIQLGLHKRRQNCCGDSSGSPNSER